LHFPFQATDGALFRPQLTTPATSPHPGDQTADDQANEYGDEDQGINRHFDAQGRWIKGYCDPMAIGHSECDENQSQR
jgi:hypothetical protein